MKFSLLLIFIIFMGCSTSKEQTTESNTQVPLQSSNLLADFYISFGSVCCGPPSIKPLIDYTLQFTNKFPVRFESIIQYSGLGKEGEFALAFFCEDWTENQKEKFFDGLKKIKWIEQNQSNFGGVSFHKNYRLDHLHEAFRLQETSMNFEEFLSL